MKTATFILVTLISCYLLYQVEVRNRQPEVLKFKEPFTRLDHINEFKYNNCEYLSIIKGDKFAVVHKGDCKNH